MVIKTIHVKNFKSFKELRADLGKFNVLIGANASGKSNFIQVFKFLRDIARDGLENAIAMQGGAEYLTNLNSGTAEDLSIQFVVSGEGEGDPWTIAKSRTGKTNVELAPLEATCAISIGFAKKGAEFEVTDERLTLKGEFRTFERDRVKSEAPKPHGLGEVLISRVGEEICEHVKPPEGLSLDQYEISPGIREVVSRRSHMLVYSPFFVGSDFADVAIYDFDPKLPKKATPITGRADLEEDGSNLAIVLENIMENADRKRKLENLLGDLLPFVAGLKVEKFAHKSLLFNLRETYAKKQFLPASLISDGTINVTALIAALYFEKKPVAIIEEPERNIHPSLISKVVAMMKDASKNKQIIVTTHNPEVVRHADIGDVLLVSRSADGFSTVSRPSESKEIKIFLQNEMGLEELFVQNLLHS